MCWTIKRPLGLNSSNMDTVCTIQLKGASILPSAKVPVMADPLAKPTRAAGDLGSNKGQKVPQPTLPRKTEPDQLGAGTCDGAPANVNATKQPANDKQWKLKDVIRKVSKAVKRLRSNLKNPGASKLINKKISQWDYDVFEVKELTKGKPLAATAYAVLEHLGLIDALNLPKNKLHTFLKLVEAHYQDKNPYHNATHAADVVQTVGCCLGSDGIAQQLKPLAVLALVLAAIVHDVGHPGLTNDYLNNVQDELAVRHANSTNEWGHLALGWQLLQQSNFLAHLSQEDMGYVWGLVQEMVLATDMKGHKDLLYKLAEVEKQFGPNLANWSAEGQVVFLSAVLHTADISNCAKPFGLSLQWAMRINNEVWSQGDKEAELGLPSVPFNQRANANVPSSQIFFSKAFVRPCFEALASIAPATAEQALRCMDANQLCWTEQQNKGVKVPQ